MVGDYEEDVNGSTMTIKHYSFNGQIIATRRKVGTNDVLRYTHADHLGSTSGQTDTAGNAVTGTYVRHYAYGTVRAGDTSTLNTDRTFTGQKADSTGLLYLNARYYDPTLGQFLSPDTLVPDAGVLFDYNRFAYARLNPLRYNDPSGHAPQHPGDPDPDNAACATDWCWQNRWHQAHGYSWNGSGWSGDGDAHFYDEGILSDVLREAGIAFVTGWNWGNQQRQMSAIGQGVVALGQKLNQGLAGLRQLLGGGASLHHVNQTPGICQGRDACALPPGTHNVYYSTGFLNDNSSQYIAMTTVHELAHVIDWHNRINMNGASVSFSFAWHGTPITAYAACAYPDCFNPWERWAEAVTVYTYGSAYEAELRSRNNGGFRIGEVALNIQMARMHELLNGVR
jgi:RHS repeat-associated protein